MSRCRFLVSGNYYAGGGLKWFAPHNNAQMLPLFAVKWRQIGLFALKKPKSSAKWARGSGRAGEGYFLRETSFFAISSISEGLL